MQVIICVVSKIWNTNSIERDGGSKSAVRRSGVKSFRVIKTDFRTRRVTIDGDGDYQPFPRCVVRFVDRQPHLHTEELFSQCLVDGEMLIVLMHLTSR